MATQFTCDCCKAVIPADHIVLNFSLPPDAAHATSQDKSMDLCNPCVDTKTLRQIVSGS